MSTEALSPLTSAQAAWRVGADGKPRLEVVLVDDSGGLGSAVLGMVGGYANVWQAADATLTRPANATAYAAHQALGSGSSCIFKFSNFFRKNGQTGILSGLRLVASASGIAAANMGSIRGHLYNALPASPPASDQQVFASLVANKDIKLGVVDFSTWNIGGAGSDMIDSYGTPIISPMPIKAAAGAADLYAVFEATAAFTPIASIILAPYASQFGD